MKRLAFELIYWTWCLPQTLLGLLVFLAAKIFDRNTKTGWVESTYTRYIKSEKFWGSVSLGRFILLFDYGDYYEHIEWIRDMFRTHWVRDTEDTTLKHEWGHTLQNFLLGPLYLIVIGIPSIVWATFFEKYRRRTGTNYYSFYTEAWAERWGGVER